jgi:predicted permease
METLWDDVRLALRQLARNPTFAAVAITSLVLGIGANTAVFSLVNALLVRPLPVRDPSRLVAVASTLGTSSGPLWTSYLNFRDLRQASTSFSGMAGHANLPLTLGRAGEAGQPEQVLGQLVSGNFFAVLGVEAARGRTFTPEEDEIEGAHPVAVLSHGFWQRRFGGDSHIVGGVIEINQQAFTVVGVAPKDFYGVLSTYPTDVFVPVGMWRRILSGTFRAGFLSRGYAALSIVARLRPGVSAPAAGAEMESLARRLVEQFPRDNEHLGVVVLPLDQARMRPKQHRELVLGAAILMTGAGLVLLIACANLSSLLLGRIVARQQEIAVRIAIGAAQKHLVRMLMTESVVLAALGGGAGLALAFWLRRLVWSLRPPRLPENLNLGLDWRVLLFTSGATLLAALLLGLGPALQMRSRTLAQVLRGSGVAPAAGLLGPRFGFRNLLVSLQIALSLVSLSAAILFVSRLLDASNVDLGFEKRKLLVVGFDPAAAGYDEARALQLYDRLSERVRGLPGVASAAVAESLNLYPVGYLLSEIRIEGRDPHDLYLTQVNTVAPGYLGAVGIALLAGRDFTTADRAGAPPVAIVNRAMARLHWPGEDAVGKRFIVASTGEVVEVVGMARDARYKEVDEQPYPYFYRPILQHFSAPVFLHVRTTSDPAGVLPAVRGEIRSTEPRLALSSIWTMSDVLERSLWASRMAAVLLSAFGGLGLLLAMIGLYGAVAHSMSRRRKEIGIRLALGAQRSAVLWLVVRQGMVLAAAGLGLGLLAASITARVALHAAGGLGQQARVSFTFASLLLAVTAFVTNLVVARKATGISPLRALRGD